MDITEDEAELYDRQIRLWGIESQRKLRNTRVLLIGLKGFGAELAKNIILAGVKSVTLLDSENVTLEDSAAQFLIPTDAVGQNRAAASLKRAQALNPMVNVIVDTDDVSKKNSGFFSNFEVVVATSCSLAEQTRINNACREQGVKFFCGDVLGMFGYCFADLQRHNCFMEVPQTNKNLPKKEPIPITQNFVPLEDALTFDWTKDARRLKKMDPSFFLMLVLHSFQKTYNRLPDRNERVKDVEKLKDTAKSILNEMSIPEDKIPEPLFESVFGEVSPVCAIVGGIVAQDIIKAVSQQPSSIYNFFFFNPENCCGFVERAINA